MMRIAVLVWWTLGIALATSPARAAEPVVLRVGSFTLAPAHTPHAVIAVKNLTDATYEGTLRVRGPAGWNIVPAEQKVSVAPGQTKRVVFTVQHGTIVQANSYPIEVTAQGAGASVVHRQNVVCASAPYFRPEIDGKLDDWNDAIPVTFTTAGKKTSVSTYWNRRAFALLVAVEEDQLVPWKKGAVCDAVQVAISPEDTATGTSPDQPAGRYEFLFVADGGRGKCFHLASPDTKLAEAANERDLTPLAFDQAEVAVARQGTTTYYDCAIPFKTLADIRPGEGREFCLSILVHDPDGTGLRDWGQAAGLWPSERNRLAWSRWIGAKWGPEPPFDNKTPWGLCSSKY
jgi:hypothetical protein